MADSPASDLSDGAYLDRLAVDRAAGLRDPDVAAGVREQDFEDRIGAAGVRDTAADARDLTALGRDQASVARSRAMSARDFRSDQASAQPVTAGEIVMRAGQERLRVARDRARGADYRSLADKDRQAAARDREHAADDRLLAGTDRATFARLLGIMDRAALLGARSGEASVAEDIAPREATSGELRRASRYFELSRDLMVTATLDGYFKSVNPALEHILGWSSEQFLARPFIDFVHPEDRAATLREVEGLAEGEVTISFVNRYEASDGGYRCLDWTAIVASGEGLIYASARDVTERERAKAALAASEKRTRQILEGAHDAFVATDDRDVIIDWNAQAQVAFGWTREEALGRDLADTIFPENYRDEHRRGLQLLLAGSESDLVGVRRELYALHRDGRRFPIELTMTPRQTDTGFAFNAFVHDISDRREAVAEAERSRALSERLLLAQDAVSRVFAEAQSSDQAMRGLVAALGGAMGWQLGSWWSRVEDSDVLRCRSVWHAQTPAREFEAVTLGLVLVRGQALPGRVWASGKPAWTPDLATDPSFPRMEVAARAGLHASVCVPVVVDGAFRGAVEFFSAQTGTPDQPTRQILSTIAEQMGALMRVLDERAALVEKLERLALSDELTGLANRRAWQHGLEREIARARRHGEPLCVAMIDLDHFKRFNDAHGHQAGDGLLRDLSQAWQPQLRAGDILARYGGEEFALALHAQPLQGATTVLERLRATVPKGQTCSAGLAEFDGAESADQLVGRADVALYDAKLLGRDRVVIASSDAGNPSRAGL